MGRSHRSNYYRGAFNVGGAALAYAAKKVLMAANGGVADPYGKTYYMMQTPGSSRRSGLRPRQNKRAQIAKAQRVVKRMAFNPTLDTRRQRRSYDHGRVYNTTGRKSKTYRVKRKPKAGFYAKSGSIKKVENGGTVTIGGTHSMYVGHAAGIAQVWESACRALFRLLFRQSKRIIRNWNDVVEAVPNGTTKTLFYRYTYRELAAATDVTPDTTDITVAIANTDTYKKVVEDFITSLAGSITSNHPHEVTQLILFDRLIVNSEDTLLASVSVPEVMLKCNLTSRLSIQNRTLAVSGTDDHDAGNVNNNPIVGKLYRSKISQNGFKFHLDDTPAGQSATAFISNKTTGMIYGDSVGDFTNVLQKPPPFWFFKAQKGSRVAENPGNIFSSYFSDYMSINFNRLMNKLITYVNNGTNHHATIFKAEMFGLEKMLDSGRDFGENLSIAWEVNQTYSCGATYKPKVACAPLLEVGATATAL